MVHFIASLIARKMAHLFVDSLIHSFIGLSTHRFTNSLIYHCLFSRSVVQGFFHLIALASQPPFAHLSLMRLTTLTIIASASKKNPIDHLLPIVLSYFEISAPGRAEHYLLYISIYTYINTYIHTYVYIRMYSYLYTVYLVHGFCIRQ